MMYQSYWCLIHDVMAHPLEYYIPKAIYPETGHASFSLAKHLPNLGVLLSLLTLR